MAANVLWQRDEGVGGWGYPLSCGDGRQGALAAGDAAASGEGRRPTPFGKQKEQLERPLQMSEWVLEPWGAAGDMGPGRNELCTGRSPAQACSEASCSSACVYCSST